MTSESSEKIEKKKKKKWLRALIQSRKALISVLLVGGLYVSYAGYIEPKNTYIRCDDVSIWHEPNKDTVSIALLLVVSLLVPLAMMSLVESINQCSTNERSPFKVGLKTAFKKFLSLLVGSLFAFFLVEVLKTATSEARPHFMKSCSPKSCNLNVTKDHSDHPWIHVMWTDCLNPYNLKHNMLLDVMKSFPSGHACIGIFSAVFMTIYVQLRVKAETWSLLFVAWLQTMWWTWALLCCASRIWDRRHHWWDVLAGAVIGGIAAYATVAYLCKWFDSDESQRNSEGGRNRLEGTPESEIPMPLLPFENGHLGRQTR